jgi:hypothetical protein
MAVVVGREQARQPEPRRGEANRLPTMSRPRRSPATAATVSRHSSAVASIRRARGSSASPARVRRTPSGRRANSRAPSSRSRWPTCRLTAGWAMYSRSEARVKLPSSATATK